MTHIMVITCRCRDQKHDITLQTITSYMWAVSSPAGSFMSLTSVPPSQELPRFKELIFEDFSRFLLVENMFEEVVLQSVSKDIMMGEGKRTK